MKNRKLFTLIFPTYLILIILVTTFFALYEQHILNTFYMQEIQKDLEARARLIREQITNYDLRDSSHLDSVIKSLSKSGYVRITIILTDGKVIADSDKDPKLMDNHADRPEIKAAFNNTNGRSVRYSYTLKKQLIYIAVPLKINRQLSAAVRIAFPLSAYQNSINSLRSRILIGGLLALILGALFSYFISRRISKPIEEIKKGAGRFAAGNFKYPVVETGSAEIRSLASALNTMARELNHKIQTISIQRSEQEAMFSSMREGVLALDDRGMVIRINAAAKRFFNLQGHTVEKSFVQEIIRDKEILDFIQSALTNNTHLDKEVTIIRQTKKIYRLSSDPLSSNNGEKIGSLILINEITRIKQLDKMRQEFVANVSHELKTPITSIKGYVETLLEGGIKDEETQKKFLTITAQQTDRMNLLINDLLQLSKIEQQEGTHPLQKTKETAFSVVQVAVEECRKSADEKGIEIVVDGDLEASAFFNSSLLEQAIVNLLSNAIKYSDPDSRVLIHIKTDQSTLQISVQDFGCGIEQKFHNRLFERFFRVDKARSRELGGTGLGLAIVKHIAMVHQGNISVTSKVGEGSTFTIYLPL